MTLYEFLVPLIALAVAAIGTLIIHIAAKRMDARQKDDHPAE
ncbi:MAG: hypothetical protein ACT4OK_21420 [Gemmobacter sp.]